MIWLAMALAATPDDLAARLPDARDALDRCASEGCPAADGARAAWLVALGTYLDEGVADPGLTGTVRALDPDLFATLPEPLRAAAGSPLPWASSVASRAVAPEAPGDPAPSASPEPAPAPAAPAPGGPGARLTVVVVDPEDRPVPGAFVRFDAEGERHRVHTETGAWTGSMLYLPNGAERAFLKGTRLDFAAFAPGYGYERLVYVVPKRKKALVVVRLHPEAFAVPAEAPDVARDAEAARARWIEAEAAYVSGPTEAARESAERAARATAEFARAWMDAGGGDAARELCLSTGSLALCGG